MGRAVYSDAYATPAPAPTVAVRTEPEPNVDMVVERWSSWNHFDPDSDEFFHDAEYEAFVNPDELSAQHGDATSLITDRVIDMSDSSESSDQESDSSAEASENQTEGSSPTEWNGQDSPNSYWSARTMNVEHGVRASFYAVRVPNPSTSNVEGAEDSHMPSEIEPVSTQLVDRSPSPEISMPSTPPPRQTFPIFRRQVTSDMLTPSPTASVTPRFYSWPAPASPVIPAFLPVHRTGPFTNPRARMSYTRIDSSPVHVRITNPVM